VAEAIDPFTECNKRIWDVLVAHQPFKDLFKHAGRDRPGNRLSTVPREGFNTANKERLTMGPADAGEVLVTQRGGRFPSKGENSRIINGRKVYGVQIATDRTDVVLMNRFVWHGLCALHRAGDDLGLSFVREWDLEPVQEGFNPVRGTLMWAAVFDVTVSMYWTRASILQ
jgi:hypothetical protein